VHLYILIRLSSTANVTQIQSLTFVNFVTPKAGAKLEPLSAQTASNIDSTALAFAALGDNTSRIVTHHPR